MLRYALMCITACMFVFGKNNPHSTYIKPISPFSGNLYKELNIPTESPEFGANVIESMDGKNAARDLETYCKNNPDDEICKRYGQETENAGSTDQLASSGREFIAQFMDYEPDRNIRQDDDDDEMESRDAVLLTKASNETAMAQNLTITLADIDEDKKQNFKNCCEAKSKAEDQYLANQSPPKPCCPPKKSAGSMGFLAKARGMSFYKYGGRTNHKGFGCNKAKSYSGSSGGCGNKLKKAKNSNLVTINLYPSGSTKEKLRSLIPGSLDYIGLMSTDTSLRNEPALRLRVIDKGDEFTLGDELKDDDSYSLYRYKRHQTKSGTVHYNINIRKPYVPVLFINSGAKSGRRKRNEARYLDEANFLIRNVKTTYKRDGSAVEHGHAGVLMVPRSELSTLEDPALMQSLRLKIPAYGDPLATTRAPRPIMTSPPEPGIWEVNNLLAEVSNLGMVTTPPEPTRGPSKNGDSSTDRTQFFDSNMPVGGGAYVNSPLFNSFNLVNSPLDTPNVANREKAAAILLDAIKSTNPPLASAKPSKVEVPPLQPVKKQNFLDTFSNFDKNPSYSYDLLSANRLLSPNSNQYIQAGVNPVQMASNSLALHQASFNSRETGSKSNIKTDLNRPSREKESDKNVFDSTLRDFKGSFSVNDVVEKPNAPINVIKESFVADPQTWEKSQKSLENMYEGESEQLLGSVDSLGNAHRGDEQDNLEMDFKSYQNSNGKSEAYVGSLNKNEGGDEAVTEKIITARQTEDLDNGGLIQINNDFGRENPRNTLLDASAMDARLNALETLKAQQMEKSDQLLMEPLSDFDSNPSASVPGANSDAQNAPSVNGNVNSVQSDSNNVPQNAKGNSETPKKEQVLLTPKEHHQGCAGMGARLNALETLKGQELEKSPDNNVQAPSLGNSEAQNTNTNVESSKKEEPNGVAPSQNSQITNDQLPEGNSDSARPLKPFPFPGLDTGFNFDTFKSDVRPFQSSNLESLESSAFDSVNPQKKEAFVSGDDSGVNSRLNSDTNTDLWSKNDAYLNSDMSNSFQISPNVAALENSGAIARQEPPSGIESNLDANFDSSLNSEETNKEAFVMPNSYALNSLHSDFLEDCENKQDAALSDTLHNLAGDLHNTRPNVFPDANLPAPDPTVQKSLKSVDELIESLNFVNRLDSGMLMPPLPTHYPVLPILDTTDKCNDNPAPAHLPKNQPFCGDDATTKSDPHLELELDTAMNATALAGALENVLRTQKMKCTTPCPNPHHRHTTHKPVYEDEDEDDDDDGDVLDLIQDCDDDNEKPKIMPIESSDEDDLVEGNKRGTGNNTSESSSTECTSTESAINNTTPITSVENNSAPLDSIEDISGTSLESSLIAPTTEESTETTMTTLAPATLKTESVPTITKSASETTKTTVTSKSGTVKTTTSHTGGNAAATTSKTPGAMLSRLQNLEKDLKLVVEVQGILNGAKKPTEASELKSSENRRRRKRNAAYFQQRRRPIRKKRCRKRCDEEEDEEDEEPQDEEIEDSMCHPVKCKGGDTENSLINGLGAVMGDLDLPKPPMPVHTCPPAIAKRFIFGSSKKKRKRKKKKERSHKKKKKKWRSPSKLPLKLQLVDQDKTSQFRLGTVLKDEDAWRRDSRYGKSVFKVVPPVEIITVKGKNADDSAIGHADDRGTEDFNTDINGPKHEKNTLVTLRNKYYKHEEFKNLGRHRYQNIESRGNRSGMAVPKLRYRYPRSDLRKKDVENCSHNQFLYDQLNVTQPITDTGLNSASSAKEDENILDNFDWLITHNTTKSSKHTSPSHTTIRSLPREYIMNIQDFKGSTPHTTSTTTKRPRRTTEKPKYIMNILDFQGSTPHPKSKGKRLDPGDDISDEFDWLAGSVTTEQTDEFAWLKHTTELETEPNEEVTQALDQVTQMQELQKQIDNALDNITVRVMPESEETVTFTLPESTEDILLQNRVEEALNQVTTTEQGEDPHGFFDAMHHEQLDITTESIQTELPLFEEITVEPMKSIEDALKNATEIAGQLKDELDAIKYSSTTETESPETDISPWLTPMTITGLFGTEAETEPMDVDEFLDNLKFSVTSVPTTEPTRAQEEIRTEVASLLDTETEYGDKTTTKYIEENVEDALQQLTILAQKVEDGMYDSTTTTTEEKVPLFTEEPSTTTEEETYVRHKIIVPPPATEDQEDKVLQAYNEATEGLQMKEDIESRYTTHPSLYNTTENMEETTTYVPSLPTEMTAETKEELLNDILGHVTEAQNLEDRLRTLLITITQAVETERTTLEPLETTRTEATMLEQNIESAEEKGSEAEKLMHNLRIGETSTSNANDDTIDEEIGTEKSKNTEETEMTLSVETDLTEHVYQQAIHEASENGYLEDSFTPEERTLTLAETESEPATDFFRITIAKEEITTTEQIDENQEVILNAEEQASEKRFQEENITPEELFSLKTDENWETDATKLESSTETTEPTEVPEVIEAAMKQANEMREKVTPEDKFTFAPLTWGVPTMLTELSTEMETIKTTPEKFDEIEEAARQATDSRFNISNITPPEIVTLSTEEPLLRKNLTEAFEDFFTKTPMPTTEEPDGFLEAVKEQATATQFQAKYFTPVEVSKEQTASTEPEPLETTESTVASVIEDELVTGAINQATEAKYQPTNVTPEDFKVTIEETEATGIRFATTESPSEFEEAFTRIVDAPTPTPDELLTNAVKVATEFEGVKFTPEERITAETIETESSFSPITLAPLFDETTIELVEGIILNAEDQATEKKNLPENITPNEMASAKDFGHVTAEETFATTETTTETQATTEDALVNAVEQASESGFRRENITPEQMTARATFTEDIDASVTSESSASEEASTGISDEFLRSVMRQATAPDFDRENFTPEELTTAIGHTEPTDTERTSEWTLIMKKETPWKWTTTEEVEAALENAKHQITDEGFLVKNYTAPDIATTLEFFTEKPLPNILEASAKTEDITDIPTIIKLISSTEPITQVSDEIANDAKDVASEGRYQVENITPEDMTRFDLETEYQKKIIHLFTESESDELFSRIVTSTEPSEELAKNAQELAHEMEYQEENITPEERATLEYTTGETKSEPKLTTRSEFEEIFLKETDMAEVTEEAMEDAIKQATDISNQVENIKPDEELTREMSFAEDTTQSESVTESVGTYEEPNDLVENALNEATKKVNRPDNITPEQSSLLFSVITEEETKSTESSSEGWVLHEYTTEPDELIKNAEHQATETLEYSNLEERSSSEPEYQTEEELTRRISEYGIVTRETTPWSTEEPDLLVNSALNQSEYQPENFETETTEETVTTETFTPHELFRSRIAMETEWHSKIAKIFTGETTVEGTVDLADEIVQTAINEATEMNYQEENITAEDITSFDLETEYQKKIIHLFTESESDEVFSRIVTSTEPSEELAKNAEELAHDMNYQEENITPEERATLEYTTGETKSEQKLTTRSEFEEIFLKETDTAEVTEEAMEDAIKQATDISNQVENIKPDEELTREMSFAEDTTQSESVTESLDTYEPPNELVENALDEVTNKANHPDNITPEQSSLLFAVITSEATKATESSSEGWVLHEYTSKADELVKNAEHQATETLEYTTLEQRSSSEEEVQTEEELTRRISEFEIVTRETTPWTTEEPDLLVNSALNQSEYEPENFETETTEETVTAESFTPHELFRSRIAMETEWHSKIAKIFTGETTVEGTVDLADEIIQTAINEATEMNYQEENITAEDITSFDLETEYQKKIIHLFTESESDEVFSRIVTSTEISEELAKNAEELAKEADYQEENITPEESATLEYTTGETKSEPKLTTRSEFEEIFLKETETAEEVTEEAIEDAMKQATDVRNQDENIKPDQELTREMSFAEDTTQSGSVTESLATYETPNELVENALNEVTEQRNIPDNVTPEQSSLLFSVITEEETKSTESSSEGWVLHEYTSEPEELIKNAEHQATETLEYSTLEERSSSEPEYQTEEELTRRITEFEIVTRETTPWSTEEPDLLVNSALNQSEYQPENFENETTEETSTAESFTPHELFRSRIAMETEWHSKIAKIFTGETTVEGTVELADEIIQTAINEATERNYQEENITPEEMITEETISEPESRFIVTTETPSELEEILHKEIVETTQLSDELAKNAEIEASITLPEDVTFEEKITTEKEVSYKVVFHTTEILSEFEEIFGKETTETTSETTDEAIENAEEQATGTEFQQGNITPEPEFTKEFTKEEPTENLHLKIRYTETEETSSTETEFQQGEDELAHNAEDQATENQYNPENVTAEETTYITLLLEETKLTTEFEPTWETTEQTDELAEGALKQATESENEEPEEVISDEEEFTHFSEPEVTEIVEIETSTSEVNVTDEIEQNVASALEQASEAEEPETSSEPPSSTERQEVTIMTKFPEETEPEIEWEAGNTESITADTFEENVQIGLNEATKIEEMETKEEELIIITTPEILASDEEIELEITTISEEEEYAEQREGTEAVTEETAEEVQTALEMATEGQSVEDEIRLGKLTEAEVGYYTKEEEIQETEKTKVTIEEVTEYTTETLEENVETAIEEATEAQEMERTIEKEETTTATTGVYTEELETSSTETTPSEEEETDANLQTVIQEITEMELFAENMTLMQETIEEGRFRGPLLTTEESEITVTFGLPTEFPDTNDDNALAEATSVVAEMESNIDEFTTTEPPPMLYSISETQETTEEEATVYNFLETEANITDEHVVSALQQVTEAEELEENLTTVEHETETTTTSTITAYNAHYVTEEIETSVQVPGVQGEEEEVEDDVKIALEEATRVEELQQRIESGEESEEATRTTEEHVVPVVVAVNTLSEQRKIVVTSIPEYVEKFTLGEEKLKNIQQTVEEETIAEYVVTEVFEEFTGEEPEPATFREMKHTTEETMPELVVTDVFEGFTEAEHITVGEEVSEILEGFTEEEKFPTMRKIKQKKTTAKEQTLPKFVVTHKEFPTEIATEIPQTQFSIVEEEELPESFTVEETNELESDMKGFSKEATSKPRHTVKHHTAKETEASKIKPFTKHRHHTHLPTVLGITNPEELNKLLEEVEKELQTAFKENVGTRRTTVPTRKHHGFPGVKGGDQYELHTQKMKQVPTKQPEGKIPEEHVTEAYEEQELPHFSAEGPTICPICDENGRVTHEKGKVTHEKGRVTHQKSRVTHEPHVSKVPPRKTTVGHHLKHHKPVTSPLKHEEVNPKGVSEQFEETDMPQFTATGSTICELCEANKKTTPKRGHPHKMSTTHKHVKLTTALPSNNEEDLLVSKSLEIIDEIASISGEKLTPSGLIGIVSQTTESPEDILVSKSMELLDELASTSQEKLTPPGLIRIVSETTSRTAEISPLEEEITISNTLEINETELSELAVVTEELQRHSEEEESTTNAASEEIIVSSKVFKEKTEEQQGEEAKEQELSTEEQKETWINFEETVTVANELEEEVTKTATEEEGIEYLATTSKHHHKTSTFVIGEEFGKEISEETSHFEETEWTMKQVEEESTEPSELQNVSEEEKSKTATVEKEIDYFATLLKHHHETSTFAEELEKGTSEKYDLQTSIFEEDTREELTELETEATWNEVEEKLTEPSESQKLSEEVSKTATVEEEIEYFATPSKHHHHHKTSTFESAEKSEGKTGEELEEEISTHHHLKTSASVTRSSEEEIEEGELEEEILSHHRAETTTKRGSSEKEEIEEATTTEKYSLQTVIIPVSEEVIEVTLPQHHKETKIHTKHTTAVSTEAEEEEEIKNRHSHLAEKVTVSSEEEEEEEYEEETSSTEHISLQTVIIPVSEEVVEITSHHNTHKTKVHTHHTAATIAEEGKDEHQEDETNKNKEQKEKSTSSPPNGNLEETEHFSKEHTHHIATGASEEVTEQNEEETNNEYTTFEEINETEEHIPAATSQTVFETEEETTELTMNENEEFGIETKSKVESATEKTGESTTEEDYVVDVNSNESEEEEFTTDKHKARHSTHPHGISHESHESSMNIFNRTAPYTEFVINKTTPCNCTSTTSIPMNKSEFMELLNVTERTTVALTSKPSTIGSEESDSEERTGFEVISLSESLDAETTAEVPEETSNSEEYENGEDDYGTSIQSTTSAYDDYEYEEDNNETKSEDLPASYKKNNSGTDLWKVGTTMVLLLSSVVANHTKHDHHHKHASKHHHHHSSTAPSIYVDLPIFLPNYTIKPEVPPQSQNEFMEIDSDNATESIILFVNGPNDEAIKKLNGSKWYRRVDKGPFVHEAAKSHHITTAGTEAEEETAAVTEEVSAIPEANLELPSFIKLDSCSSTDFEEGNRCFCAIDSLVTSLKHGEFDESATPTLHCLNYLKVDDGLVISDDSVPEIRRKRSFMYGKQIMPTKREIVDYTKALFDSNYRIFNTDDKMYALPGSDVIIPCLNRNDVVEYNRYLQYSWMFEDEVSVTSEKIEENGGNLVLKDLLPKDSGNYTCLVTSRLNQKNNVPQKYYHRLVVITTPIYKIVTNLKYKLNNSCELSDGDLIASYLPKMLEGVLCGYQQTICKVEIRRPQCMNRKEEKLLNVTVIVTMSRLTEIDPEIVTKNCKINCQMSLYSELAGILIKNVEIFEKLPVISEMKPKHLEFTPKNVTQLNGKDAILWSSPPVVMIICPLGFGVERKTPRLCVVCPKNTFNKGYESYCKTCPAGQFQPAAGSAVCRICSSPLENRACLRVLYSNTKYFKVYVAVAFTIVLAMIISILYCLSRPPNENGRSDTAFNGRRRGEEAPLLRHNRIDNTRTVPPVPAPDF